MCSAAANTITDLFLACCAKARDQLAQPSCRIEYTFRLWRMAGVGMLVLQVASGAVALPGVHRYGNRSGIDRSRDRESGVYFLQC